MTKNYTQDRKGYFKCPTCDKPFSSQIVLKIHMKKEQCFKPQQLSQDKSSVIKNESKKDCVSKNDETTVKSAKNEDINQLNQKINKEFAESRTFSTIPQKSKICEDKTADINIEKNNEELKSRHCQECNKTFGRKRYLPIHINVVHKNMRNFQCLQCPKAFGINKTLQQHTQAVHEKLKPYHCRECNKAYCQNSILQRHIKTVHKKCTLSNVKSGTEDQTKTLKHTFNFIPLQVKQEGSSKFN